MINDLLEVQAGKEVTRGTAVTPTVKRMGITNLELTPIVEAMAHQSQRGSLAPGFETDLTKVEVEGTEEGEMIYEDAPYLLDSIFGIATPSGGGPYTRDYAGPLGTEPSIRINTLVKGNGSNVYKGSGMVMDELTVSFAKNEPITYNAHYWGKDFSTATLAALSDRTVNYVMAQQVALFIDAFGGTIGTSQFNDAFFSGELNIKTNRANYFSIGALTPKNIRNARHEVTLKLNLEFAATSKGYFDAIIGAASVLQKLIRIRATKSTQQLTLDFAGFTPKAPVAFTDEDGVTTVDMEFNGLYESGLANYLKAQSINTVSALL